MEKAMKTITLSDFSQQDTEFLADLIDTYLQDQGIQASSFAFNIEVDYEEETGGKNLSISLDDTLDVVAKLGG
jgi:hypothetical protein